MRTTFITTVLNEEENISLLIESVLSQTKKPDEIIIIDGGSSDRTVAELKTLVQRTIGLWPKNSKLKSSIRFKIIIKKGNRSVGRNEAIRNARGDVILCSDAGCVLDKKWVEKIIEPFKDKTVDVVAGYYKGRAKTIFEKCLVPYVLVMPDKANKETFLPATRSMAFRKSIWKKVGGFPEEFSHNEDYVFAQRLKGAKAKIFFQKDAVVYWIPRKNLWDASRMFFRFALGDAQAKIVRSKVFFLFFRYLIGALLIIWFFISKSYFILYTLYFILGSYMTWSIAKNYRYVRNWRAIIYLPVLQFISDASVMLGTLIGSIKQLRINSNKSRIDFFLNIYLILIVALLIITTIADIQRITHLTFLFTFFIPLLFFISKLSSKKTLVELLIFFGLGSLIIFTTFRHVRSLFYPPKILEDKIVGYAQYFGYPFNFDLLLFLVFLLIPALSVIYVFFKKNSDV